MLHALSTPHCQHTHDPRAYTDNFLTLTVPTPQRNQVSLDLVHQGLHPAPQDFEHFVKGDVGHVHHVLLLEAEGNILRQHVGYEDRRRELELLPCD